MRLNPIVQCVQHRSDCMQQQEMCEVQADFGARWDKRVPLESTTIHYSKVDIFIEIPSRTDCSFEESSRKMLPTHG